MLPRSPTYLARLIVKPRPSTLSESFPILRYLRTLGEVTKFAKCIGTINPKEKAKPLEEDGTKVVYDVEFSSAQQELTDLKWKKRRTLTFKVDANAFQPDPKDLDPYNVRGLLDQKPSLPARKFTCKLTPIKPHGEQPGNTQGTEGKPDDTTHTLDLTDYSGPFEVDRTSVFAQIYQQSDTPRHLIDGLLPKVGTDHKAAPYVDAHGNPPKARHKTRWLYYKQQRAKKLPREVQNPNFSLMKLYQDHVERGKARSATQ